MRKFMIGAALLLVGIPPALAWDTIRTRVWRDADGWRSETRFGDDATSFQPGVYALDMPAEANPCGPRAFYIIAGRATGEGECIHGR